MPGQRIKHRQMPGDVGKGTKIEMREKGVAEVVYSPRHKQQIGATACKSFKKTIRMRERAVLKERAKKEIKRQLDGR